MMNTLWILLMILLVFASGCAPSQAGGQAEDLGPSTPLAPPSQEPLTTPLSDSPNEEGSAQMTSTTVIATGAWKTYLNTQAKYSIKYPEDWTVNENVGVNGELMTTFMAPDNGQGMIVSVLNSDAVVEENPDMPNTRCEEITISGLSGWRCFDTLNFNLSTTFINQGKFYAITSSGKRPDQDIYQHFLESFALIP
jgi:hypothetical protein